MVLGIIKLLGMVVFLYLIWRNLNENYRDDLLISYGWSSTLVMLLGGRIVYGIHNWGVFGDSWTNWFNLWSTSGFNYWGGAAGVLIWSWWFSVKNEWKLWSFLEDVTPIYYLLVTFMLGEFFLSSGLNWRVLLAMVVTLLGYLSASLMQGKYRSLTWYKSGKKGFIFFFTNMIIGLLFASGAIWYKDGWINIVLYLSLSLIFGMGLVILGESYGTKN